MFICFQILHYNCNPINIATPAYAVETYLGFRGRVLGFRGRVRSNITVKPRSVRLGMSMYHFLQSADIMFFQQVEINVAAATELATVGKDEKTLSEVEDILKPVKNQTWPSGIQQS